MELHESNIDWHNEDGSTTASRYTVVREPSDDSDLHIIRVWVDDSLAFNTSEVRVEYIDYAINVADPTDRHAPSRVVRWQGELIAPPLLADPGAVWVHSQGDARREAVDELREVWIDYRREEPPFREEWSFPSYVLGDHEEN